jgi:hypothetical protein
MHVTALASWIAWLHIHHCPRIRRWIAKHNNHCCIFSYISRTRRRNRRRQMVLLTLTPAAKSAIQDYCESASRSDDAAKDTHRWEQLFSADIGTPIDHHDLVIVSNYFATHNADGINGSQSQARRLDVLLRGATVYQPPPPSKPEPVRKTTFVPQGFWPLTIFHRPRNTKP